jgi:flagellar hook-associated protein 3 FlgL
MSRIIPIPTTRVGDFFVRQNMVRQVQSDQLDLFRIQTQISSGRRLQLPSDDAPAALRAINLQRLLDRKGQIKTNLESSKFYLSAAETSIGTVSQLLGNIRGEALGVVGTLANDQARRTVVQQIDQAVKTLVATSNSKLQGRYLFAGSRAQKQPFVFDGKFVEYTGNDGMLRSYVDLERLFETNVSGTQVFGGVSAEVEGSVDLDPQLTPDTLLSTINGGGGISGNAAISITLSDAGISQTSVVDLSGAVTVRDVARLIEEGTPASANVTVEITGTGLVVRTNSGTSTILIGEVAEGRTAHELGLFTAPGGPPTNTITGDPLNPAVLKTTRLADLLGTKAQAYLVSTNSNNDIHITASQNGAAFNGLTVNFVAGAAAGSESATFNSGTNTLTVQIQDGVSTANQVAAAINAEGTFTAEADYHDAATVTQIGTNAVNVHNFGAVTTGGSGTALDTQSGLQLTNGEESATLDVSGAETVEDLLNLITGADLGLSAEINAAGTGINVRSRLSGADFTIGENGGTTATQLGIRSYNGATELADFNRGVGVPLTAELEVLDTSKLDQLQIVARDNATLSVNLATATSLDDVANLINTAVGNFAGTTAVLARLTQSGNGIELVDSSTANVNGNLQVIAPPGSDAAEYLGFVSAGTTQNSTSISDASGNYVLSGRSVVKNDLVIVTRSGNRLYFDLAGAETVQDVIDRINNNPLNTNVTAQLAMSGNGIQLVDSNVGAGTLAVETAEGSQAAQFLGFIPNGPVSINGSGAQVLTSEDRHTLEPEGAFNTLLRLRSALEEGNVEDIGRAIDQLEVDISRVNFAAAEIGTRLQNLDVIGIRHQDENVQLQSALSQDYDVDLVEAISNLTARQFAFEASMRTAASLMQISLLNYI